ncbi:MAG: hypothetical protein ABI910_07660 [Gemmatimonadota bacterium]
MAIVSSWVLGMLACAALLAPAAARAQGVRISGTTWLQSIDLHPLYPDSVSVVQVTGEGTSRRTADGRLAQCPAASLYCYFSTSGARETTNPLLQDLSLAAWGFGRGISAQAHVRARTSLGGSAARWPRMDDRFDALDAFVQVDRALGRARLGRQWASNGLGVYNFDGAALLLRRRAHSLEAYGGRALAQGLNESYRSAEIGAVDDLPPQENGYLVGLRLRLRPSDVSAVSMVYQRVITGDRSGLYSERVAFDATTRLHGLSLDGATTLDVAGHDVNEARLRASRSLPNGLRLSVEARRHRPFFELWTIWGAFSPVGFDEGRAEVGWRTAGARLQLAAHGAYRRYDDTGAGVDFLPLRSDGWRTGLDATWVASDRLVASASSAVDIGFGSSRSDASAGLRWRPSERLSLGSTLSAFQSIYEFRVGTGRVFGAAADASIRLTPDTRIAFDGGIYHHRLTHDAPGTDWSQRRASVRLEWTVGRDPGLSRSGR